MVKRLLIYTLRGNAMQYRRKVATCALIAALVALGGRSGLAQDSSVFHDQSVDKFAKEALQNITGTWSGTIYDSTHVPSPNGEFGMVVTQTKKKVSGTWSAFGENIGEVVGTVTAQAITLNFYVPVQGHPKCHITIKSKPASDTSISGSFPHVSSCGPGYAGEYGTITMTNTSPD
jgi:hypothetical protein